MMVWDKSPLTFRSIAEACRVMKVMDPVSCIVNCLRRTRRNQYHIAWFFYPPASDKRLSDEDFREIFFHLTGAYPEEVDDDPDPIFLLSNLSTSPTSHMDANHVISTLMRTLEPLDNEDIAMLLKPLFRRIAKRDLHHALMRLSVRPSIVRRRHLMAALAKANSELMYRVKRASFLVGLERTCSVLSCDYDTLDALITPKLGVGMVIPAPINIGSVDSIPFTSCWMEYPEGEWMTLHVMSDGSKLFDSSGTEVPIEDTTQNMVSELEERIYLVEYAAGRDIEIKVIDILSKDENWPEEANFYSYGRRREIMKIVIPKWLLKGAIKLDDPTDAVQHIGKETSVILWNDKGLRTYENTRHEMVLLSIKPAPCKIFRVTGGKWVETVEGSPKLGKWRISARDGDSYYPVGLIESSPEIEKHLKKLCPPLKPYIGDEMPLESPVFVQVDVNAAGWGDYGPYVNGTIVGIDSKAGMSTCVGVDELEILCGNFEEE